MAIFVRGIDRRVERMSRKDKGLVKELAFCDQEKEGQSDSRTYRLRRAEKSLQHRSCDLQMFVARRLAYRPDVVIAVKPKRRLNILRLG